MRICIDMGHTPTSPGAGGQFDELTEDREVGKRVIAELERRGHTVYNSTAPDYLGGDEEIDSRWRYANTLDIDLFCSIHFNAAGNGAHGTEVLYYVGDSHGREIAARMSAKVAAALGTYDRGPKANDWVGVICKTNATAVLLETCFCDSAEDAALYWACPWDRLITAICNGIDGNDYESEDDMTFDDVWYDKALNNKKTGDGASTTPANLLWEAERDIAAMKVTVAAISAKVDKIAAGGATVDYDKLAAKVADVIAARMKA